MVRKTTISTYLRSGLQQKINKNGFSTFGGCLKSIERILRLKQRVVLAPYFGHFIRRKTAL